MNNSTKKTYVYVVKFTSDEGEGVESVHKTLAGAEARVKKVYDEGMDSCEYEVLEMALLP